MSFQVEHVADHPSVSPLQENVRPLLKSGGDPAAFTLFPHRTPAFDTPGKTGPGQRSEWAFPCTLDPAEAPFGVEHPGGHPPLLPGPVGRHVREVVGGDLGEGVALQDPGVLRARREADEPVQDDVSLLSGRPRPAPSTRRGSARRRGSSAAGSRSSPLSSIPSTPSTIGTACTGPGASSSTSSWCHSAGATPSGGGSRSFPSQRPSRCGQKIAATTARSPSLYAWLASGKDDIAPQAAAKRGPHRR